MTLSGLWFMLHPESQQRLSCVDETISVKRRGKVKSLKEWKNWLSACLVIVDLGFEGVLVLGFCVGFFFFFKA